MAFTPRSILRFLGKNVAPFVPGVGTTIGSALEKITTYPDTPRPEEMEKAIALVEKIRAAKPSITTTEFAAMAAIQALCTRIVLDSSMPVGLRCTALGCQTVAAGVYMYVRMKAKERKDDKEIAAIHVTGKP
ncbi:MAG: hypothetical protein V3W37_05840 [Candidatus Binatia bacterium]